jgi:hypothetical protein
MGSGARFLMGENLKDLMASFFETTRYDKTGDWRKTSETSEDPDDEKIAQDEWRGNQYTGGLGTGADHPGHVAMLQSVEARRQTRKARESGKAKDHETAYRAHERALQAHGAALQSASSTTKPVHEAYATAHQAALAEHSIHGRIPE